MSRLCRSAAARRTARGWKGSAGSCRAAPRGPPAHHPLRPPRGPPADGGGRTVSRGDAGRYVCTATNRHGSARRSVDVTVEYQPSMGDADCPARRLWVEGTVAELQCNANGNPPPDVACGKLGTPAPPRWYQRHPAHAGTYQCRASNVHGTALRNVTVTVECEGRPRSPHPPRVPSPNVSRGSFSVECGADGSPPTFGWALPAAPNLRFGAHNRSVAVENARPPTAGIHLRGVQPARPHRPQRGESRLSLLLSLSLLGSVTALAAAAWGVYYMKSTACKKGEYNVRDAEGSSEAARLHRGDSGGQRELFGIPLTPT
eukprot:XP_025001476.1 intercellular adhesion molecule 5 [Gallus gallus]